MKPPSRKPDSKAGAGRRVLVFLMTVAAIAGLVWGVKRLGNLARSGIAHHDRYTVRFLDIQCDPPPGYKRAVFLAEVQYHSRFPPTIQSIDPDLTLKLTSAFAAHPWVHAVDGLSVEPDGAIRVKLRYRTPALAVKIAGAEDRFRVVDSTGVLLPLEANASGLPRLQTGVLSPTIPSGQLWPDDIVKRAVELVEAHHPRSLEKTAQGWRLTMADGQTRLLER